MTKLHGMDEYGEDEEKWHMEFDDEEQKPALAGVDVEMGA
jgi:hypothetical protein